MSTDEIIRHYPTIAPEDVRAAAAYGACLAKAGDPRAVGRLVKVKLDENISAVAKDLLVEFGHDADTVADEDLAGASHPHPFKTCQVEQRLLITFDVGFGDVRA